MNKMNFPHPPSPHKKRRELRRLILTGRDALPPVERLRRSSLITERLWQLPEFAGAGLLFIYVDFRSEVATLPLIRRCLAAGREVAVPLTRAAEQRLEAYRLIDPDHDLRLGYCGIPEPDPQRLERIAPAEIALVVLPGSVFDRQGGRLGYGGGYYDRFLAEVPSALRIGLAFEMQVLDRIPLQPHDQRLDFLVTEKEALKLDRKVIGSRSGLAAISDPTE
jgi:5-formyltetrahydrofolate cyclo-ligase